MTIISGKKRIITIFSISLVITLALLYTGYGIRKYFVHQRMVEYSLASAREDGAENLVVMEGSSGSVGQTYVYLKYLEDGYIQVYGDNAYDINGWKRLSEFQLMPGSYTLTGLRGSADKTVVLQLRISDDDGFYKYFNQWDEDVCFTIESEMRADLHVRVYPFVENIDLKARPSVYKDE